jgi:NADP-dependent aldehyde dehydrogenase
MTNINEAMQRAQAAFLEYRHKSGQQKAIFLRAIATEIEALGLALVQTAMHETNLPEARLTGERGRACMQLRQMADVVEEGSWLDATVDTALPDRLPLPKPDIRNMLVPIGPVVVFGASNFPFAYSTAGVDPAAAWAAGCSVVVKAHPAHLQTSEMVARAIKLAAQKTNMPDGVFEHLEGDFDIGQGLVMHPLTAAVGFTGSLAGGKALFDMANQRPKPIPVFAEMGSTNPVFLLPEALSENAEKFAKMYAGSITGSMGQFCTKPGLLIGIDDENLTKFTQILSNEIKNIAPALMLHSGIAAAFHDKRSQVLAQPQVTVESETATKSTDNEGIPSLASVSGIDFLNNPTLHQEVFGPFALVIKCTDQAQMQTITERLEGQLTCTIIATDNDLATYQNIVQAASLLCGRLVLNSVPTGVEVCAAMQHGGPYPASTDGRFGSVGAKAIKRFVRPFAVQGFKDESLPAELQNANPLNIWRTVNGQFTKAAI